MSGTLELRLEYEDIIRQAARFLEGPEIIADEMMGSVHVSLDLFEEAVVVETPVDKGHLRGGIGTEVYGTPPEFWGRVSTPILYGLPVEYGRKPGKMPPVDAIRYWVVRKGIASGTEADSVAYLIARAIGRRGTKGAHMFQKGWDAALPAVMRQWEELPDRVGERLGI